MQEQKEKQRILQEKGKLTPQFYKYEYYFFILTCEMRFWMFMTDMA